jgi:AdoMet-dependent rRNA methyltransferase SPB1
VQLSLDVKAKEVLAKHPRMLKVPDDFELILSDLKVLGRREYQNLLRIHHKYQNIIRNAKQDQDRKVREESKIAEPEDPDAELDRQLEATLLRIEKEKKRQAKKERILKAKMSVIASSGIDGNDEDLMLSRKIWDKLQEKGFEHVGDKTDSDSEEEEESEESSSDAEAEDSDDSVDSKQERVNKMAEEMENQIKE